MEIKDIQPYIDVMNEIKRRVDVIKGCLDGRVMLAGPPKVESAALQLRMVIELVALASLVANRELFEQQSLRFNKHWHPDKIIKDLEKLNSNFYPKPVSTSDPDNKGIRTHVPMTTGFLTKEELVEVHGQCGNLLHARNPYKSPLNYNQETTQLIDWADKVVTLLNTHEIRLLGEEHFYLVTMTGPNDDFVRMVKFQRVDA